MDHLDQFLDSLSSNQSAQGPKGARRQKQNDRPIVAFTSSPKEQPKAQMAASPAPQRNALSNNLVPLRPRPARSAQAGANLRTQKVERQTLPPLPQSANKQNNRPNRRGSFKQGRFQKKEQAPQAKPAARFIKPQANALPNVEGQLRIIHLGGLGEIGKNMCLFEMNGRILILDVGLMFPEENMPGIDCVVPNTEYLKGKEHLIDGILFTHGHFDHLGGVPYVLKNFYKASIPIYAGGLTRAIILKRQEEFRDQPKLHIETIKDGMRIKLGPFDVEFFHQAHTIPDNFGLIIRTPNGNIVHTSDFKFDATPMYDKPTDFEKLKRFAQEKTWILMCDSTGAEDEGHSLSEKTIMENLDQVIGQAKGRVIASSFGSLINRIQQIISISEKYGRYVAVDGATIKSNLEICRNLGLMKTQKGTIISPKQIENYPDNKVTLICTGAQGEQQAVLMRIASGEYPSLKLKKNDTVIFSSSVVPGNERSVQNVKDEFYRQGANVFHYKMMDIHASGHARREELKQMIEIFKPQMFFPVHGQFSMLVNNSLLAQQVGVHEDNVVIAENGKIVTFTKDAFRIEQKEVPSNYVMVDGLGVGDIGEVVLRDRQTLSEDGIFVVISIIDSRTGKMVNSPDIISRGFIYLRESKDLLSEARKKVSHIISRSTQGGGMVNWNHIKNDIRDEIGEFLFRKTQRRPMVLPVIIEV